MPCIEPTVRRPRAPAFLWAAWATVLLLAGCSAPKPPVAPTAPTAPTTARPAPAAAPAVPAPGAAPGTQAPPSLSQRITLAPPGAPRTALELRRQMAHRLVQAHPEASYLSPAPDRLLAIPVLEIELNADGSVRRINVLRHPKTGSQATQLAIDAVHRAAPYGNVSHLPRPWKVVETFLFDDQLRFKPHTLDMQ